MRLCPHCGTRKSVSLPATQRWGDTSMAQHWKKAGNKENDVDHEAARTPGYGCGDAARLRGSPEVLCELTAVLVRTWVYCTTAYRKCVFGTVTV